MPSETVDTAYAYSLYSKSKNVIHPNMDNIEKAVCNGDLNRLKRQIGNTFERLLFSVKPAIEKARHDILKTGAIVSAMTGSGAAVFGIYASKEAAVTAHAALADYYESHLVKTVGGKA
jgi:4-diphosphocytidyl-2-C-methyl-D-erythritol kinase